MTLDEAIEHAKAKAQCTAGACGQEHRELYQWLLELKALRQERSEYREFNLWLQSELHKAKAEIAIIYGGAD